MIITNNSLRSRAALALLAMTLALLGSTEVEAQNATDCSSYIRDIVASIYDDNFEAVIHLSNLSSNPNFKVEVLVALYDVMDSERHLEDPERALLLHNEMNAVLEENMVVLGWRPILALRQHIDQLAVVVIEKGSEVLEAAVFLHDCDRANSTVQRLLDLLQATNQTLSEVTVNRTVERVRWVVPLEELVPALANLSRHVAQNVDALLALYEPEPERIVDDVRVQFVGRLNQLRQDPEYAWTVTEAKQERVDEIMAGSQMLLLNGLVCLYVQKPNGTKLYVQECGPSYSACVYNYPNRPSQVAALNVTRLGPADYNFKSKYYSLRPLRIIDGQPEQPGGFRLNVYSSSSYSTSIDWLVQEVDDRIMLQSLNGTQTLCGGNELAINGNQWFAYTRANGSLAAYADECRWHVEDCTVL